MVVEIRESAFLILRILAIKEFVSHPLVKKCDRTFYVAMSNFKRRRRFFFSFAPKLKFPDLKQ